MSAIFNIDWEKFVKENLPISLRKSVTIHFIQSAVGEIKVLHENFLERKTSWLYRQRHTAQVVHIEKVLNDYFDDVERRIYIANVTFESYKYLYPDGEDPHYLQEENANPDRPMYLLEGDAGTISPDATVYVPIALKPIASIEIENFENKMRGRVDYYKTYGVNYQILYYE